MEGPPWHVGHKTAAWTSLAGSSWLAKVVILMRVPQTLHWTEYGPMQDLACSLSGPGSGALP